MTLIWNERIFKMNELYQEAYDKKIGGSEPQLNGWRMIYGEKIYFSMRKNTKRWSCSCNEHTCTHGEMVAVNLNKACDHIHHIVEIGKNREFKNLL